jgi:hypothetical protein
VLVGGLEVQDVDGALDVVAQAEPVLCPVSGDA